MGATSRSLYLAASLFATVVQSILIASHSKPSLTENVTLSKTGVKLVYNRINKAGSASMSALLGVLGERNQFSVVKKKHSSYFPDVAQYQKDLDLLPAQGVYINHAGFLEAPSYSPPEYLWINVVRDPADRLASGFYYEIDPAVRSLERVEEEVQRRKNMGVCGCWALDFNVCIRVMVDNHCELDKLLMGPQADYFCPPYHHGKCLASHAMHNMLSGYALIGVTEYMEASVAALEHKLPKFFAGASSILKTLDDENVGSAVNSLTNVTRTPVSNATKALLQMHSKSYSGDVLLYNHALQLFRAEVTKMAIPIHRETLLRPDSSTMVFETA